MALTYRTTDLARWGVGKGADLTPTEVDLNFWELLQDVNEAIAASAGKTIDYISQTGTQLYIHMTDHSIQGPFELPSATWSFRGEWQPSTLYAVNDVVSNSGGVYAVLYDHVSDTSFDPNALDGGHQLYQLILTAAGLTQAVITVATATWTPSLTQGNSYVLATNDGGLVVQLPSDATLNFPIGTTFYVSQETATGTVSYEALSGLGTIRAPSTYLPVSNLQGAVTTAFKAAANTWHIFGLLALA